MTSEPEIATEIEAAGGPSPARLETIKHITDVWRRVLACARDLTRRACVHDASKLREPEAAAFEAATAGLWKLRYPSPEYDESRAKLGDALKLHWAANDHHPEFWPHGIRGMSLIHLIELVCDWHAAVTRHETGDIRESIEANQTRFGYGDELKQILHNTVTHLETLVASHV